MPKRKAPPAASSRKKENLQAPNPPPPPPPALVKLLQKDHKVLEYFQALQENLEFDVRKWKTRARKYEADCQQLLAEKQPHQKQTMTQPPPQEPKKPSLSKNVSPMPSGQGGAVQNSDGRQQVDENIGEASENDSLPTRQDTAEDVADTPNQNRHRGQQIEDHMFDFSSDEEDDNDDNHSQPVDRSNLYQKDPPPVTPQPTLWNMTTKNHQVAIKKLKIVSSYLERLGISLVSVEKEEPQPLAQDTLHENGEAAPPTTTTSDDDESETGLLPSKTTSKKAFKRRSDQDVITDLLRTVKALVRIKFDSTNASNSESDTSHHYYYPFMTKDMLPCFEENPGGNIMPPHPAVEGFRLIQTCLCWMNAYCPQLLMSSTTTTEDHEISPNEESFSALGDSDDDRLIIGMKGRHVMVDQFVKSLAGEICEFWPFQDRSTRIQTVSLHYYAPAANSEDENNNNNNNETSGKSDQPTADQGGCRIPFGSKNHVRLAALAERCFLAKLVTSLYLFRRDPQHAVEFAWTYLVSTAPSLLLEEYPKLPPVQSLVVLEGILSASSASFSQGKQQQNDNNDSPVSASFSSLLCTRSFCLAVCATACIHRTRISNCNDDRIGDVAKVELKAFDRFFVPMLQQTDTFKNWALGSTDKLSSASLEECTNAAERLIDDMLSTSFDEGKTTTTTHSSLSRILCLALVIRGDRQQMKNIVETCLSRLHSTSGGKRRLDEWAMCKLLACVVATRQLEICSLDAYRDICQSTTAFDADAYTHQIISQQVLVLSQVAGHVASLTTTGIPNYSSDMVSCLLLCCQKLADGESVCKLIHYLCSKYQQRMGGDDDDSAHSAQSVFDLMQHVCQVTAVRVINLQRRKDRMAAFMAQAMQEQLLVRKAVTDLKKTSDVPLEDALLPCEFAIDGKGRPAEVEPILASLVGGQARLNELVKTHWRPNDLKPFDNEAPDSQDVLVRISSSEKACALSHIASWHGVINTLRKPPELLSRLTTASDISGYATGPALLQENEDMPPSPVVVILEDDAVLVDRFTDRLRCLLEELPRDFHFCSLGYSRPKTAPLFHFSSQLGIPTAIWYLTGYIISLEGARHLCDRLPVKGPVDSWIGLSMYANWDNPFGHAMGAGVQSKATNCDGVVSRKELRNYLRFRAFAANVPLCSQRVGNANLKSEKTRSWRQRDTDITFSGHG